MAGKSRVELAERRRQVAGLLLRKVLKGEIAKALGVDSDTITNDVKWLDATWQKEMAQELMAMKSRELAELREMERYCAQKLAGYNVLRNNVPVHIDGDGKWMTRWLQVKERIAKMMGLDAPEKLDVLDGRHSLMDLVKEANIVEADEPRRNGTKP